MPEKEASEKSNSAFLWAAIFSPKSYIVGFAHYLHPFQGEYEKSTFLQVSWDENITPDSARKYKTKTQILSRSKQLNLTLDLSNFHV